MSHYLQDEQIVGWGPTVEEINYLATLFEEVHHIGCLHSDPAPDSALPYSSDKIKFIPVPPAGGNKLVDKFKILKVTPLYIKTIWEALNTADVVHLRCPANVPLIALLILMLRRKPGFRWAKYAGNWAAGTDYPFFFRFQRFLLDHYLPKCVVTINGQWEHQKPHVISFINPCLSLSDVQAAVHETQAKEISSPIQLLFAGALNERKGVGHLLRISDKLNQDNVPFILNVLGDGQQRKAYETWTKDHGLIEKVIFNGWIPKPELKHFYKNAHINILPSESEGWPKVLSEGMAYGVVPVASAVSSIPQILDQTKAGISIPPYDIDGFVEAIKMLKNKPEVWGRYSKNSLVAAPEFTYEHYLLEVRQLFKSSWNIEL